MRVMLTLLHVVAAVLACARLVELILEDRITASLRTRFKASYLWQCPRCLSVWAGIYATVAFAVFPWLNWPLALSWAYLAMRDSRFLTRRRSMETNGQVQQLAQLTQQVAQLREQIANMGTYINQLVNQRAAMEMEVIGLRRQVQAMQPTRPAVPERAGVAP